MPGRAGLGSGSVNLVAGVQGSVALSSGPPTRCKFGVARRRMSHVVLSRRRGSLGFGSHSVRSTSAAGVRAAMRAGIAATRLARISAPAATNIREAGTEGWGTALMLRAKRIHSWRPMAMPTGTPTTAAIAAIAEACEATVAANCRAVNPRVFNKARSRLCRRTDAIKLRASATIAPTARPAARMTGVAPVDW